MSPDARPARAANLGLRFLLELAMLAALAAWGLHTGRSAAADVALGLGAPLCAAALWGRYAAPKSSRRLDGAGLRAVQLTLLGAGVVALAAAGWVVLAVLDGVAVVVNAVLLEVWDQE